jgi:hypothetical protein
MPATKSGAHRRNQPQPCDATVTSSVLPSAAPQALHTRQRAVQHFPMKNCNTVPCRFFIATEDGPVSEQVARLCLSAALYLALPPLANTPCMLVPSPGASLMSLLLKTPVRARACPACVRRLTPVAVDVVILCLPLRRCLVKRGVSAVSAGDFLALAALCKDVREVPPSP